MAEPGPSSEPPWLSRLAWFVGLWLVSVGALAVVAFAIRKVLI